MNELIISKGYSILHFDEYPILFIGLNDKDEIVVGSFLYENDDENLLFFHSIVNRHIAHKFLNKELTYKKLLESASEIFLIEKNYNDKIIDYKSMKFGDIDPDILPLDWVFCPNVDEEVIYNITGIYSKFITYKFSEVKTNIDNRRIYYSKHKSYLYKDDLHIKVHTNKDDYHIKDYDTVDYVVFKAPKVYFNKINNYNLKPKKVLTNA